MNCSKILKQNHKKSINRAIEMGRLAVKKWSKDKDIETLKRELENTKMILDNYLREYGHMVVDNYDFYWLIGWLQGLQEEIKDRVK